VLLNVAHYSNGIIIAMELCRLSTSISESGFRACQWPGSLRLRVESESGSEPPWPLRLGLLPGARVHTHRRPESRAYSSFNSRAADGAAGPAPVNAPMTALRRSCDMTRAVLVGSVNSRASFAAFETLESLTLLSRHGSQPKILKANFPPRRRARACASGIMMGACHCGCDLDWVRMCQPETGRGAGPVSRELPPHSMPVLIVDH
jgi:hypothetical protein